MNLELNLLDIYEKIPSNIRILSKDILLEQLDKTFAITNLLLSKLKSKKLSGLERDI